MQLQGSVNRRDYLLAHINGIFGEEEDVRVDSANIKNCSPSQRYRWLCRLPAFLLLV